MKDHEDLNNQVLIFDISACELPPHFKKMLLSAVFVQLHVSCLVELPASSQFMSLTVVQEETKPVQLNGPYGVVSFSDVSRDKFKGLWQISVDLRKMKDDPKLKELLDEKGFLDPGLFENIQILLDYKACVFNCT